MATVADRHAGRIVIINGKRVRLTPEQEQERAEQLEHVTREIVRGYRPALERLEKA